MSKLFAAGQPWTTPLVDALLNDFDAGLDLKELCVKHGRSPAAIISQLQRLGLIMQHGYRSYHKVNPDPWVMVAQVQSLAKELEREDVKGTS